jgi:ABC-type spermidine/putrescine transport system permease subunit II
MMGPALVIALLFAPLAALMGFAISDGEYSRHYPDRRTPFLMSLQTALVVFVVFVLLALFAGWLMPRILSPVS